MARKKETQKKFVIRPFEWHIERELPTVEKFNKIVNLQGKTGKGVVYAYMQSYVSKYEHLLPKVISGK